MNLSNRINIAAIYAKNSYLGDLFYQCMASFRILTVKEMLEHKAEEYQQFGFE
jgi:hypothetical protein